MKFTLRTYPGNVSDVLTEDGTVVAQFPPNSGDPPDNIRSQAQRLMFAAPEVAAERDRLLADNRKLREALEEIGRYKGEGGASTPWREIVRDLGDKARAVLAQFPPGGVRREAQSLMFKAPEVVAERDRLRDEVQELRVILERILRAHDSGNNGAVMGEAVLCRMFAEQARAALAKTKPTT